MNKESEDSIEKEYKEVFNVDSECEFLLNEIEVIFRRAIETNPEWKRRFFFTDSGYIMERFQ